MANEVSERRWLVLIFVLYFLLGIGYSLLMPIWEAPDEPAHYHLAWRLARRGEYATEELNYEANQPRTFYYFGSFVIRALDKVDTKFSDYILPREYKYNIRVAERRFDWNDGNYRFLLGVYALRWMNLFFGALALWLNWKTFKWIAPDKPDLQFFALALAALTPQYLHIMSSVSNDALGTLAGAFLFYMAIRVVKEESKLPAILSILAAIVLPLVTKLTVLPISAALLAIVAGKWFFGLRQKRWLVVTGIVVLCSVGMLYFFFPEALQWTQKEITWRLFSFREKGLPPDYLKRVSNQILQTYWGKVGWIAVGLPIWIIYGLTALGLTGIILHVRRLVRERGTHPEIGAWIATLLIASFTILAVARNGLTTGATQGRFLFPAIGALSLLMIAGWHDVLPERIGQKLPLIIVSLMVALNLWLWIYGIIPVYYQPFLD
jgi:hypothetical protein